MMNSTMMTMPAICETSMPGSYAPTRRIEQAAGGSKDQDRALRVRDNSPRELARTQGPCACVRACFVLTVSDTRTEANDTGGRAIRELLEGAGHSVSGHAIVKDEAAQVAAIVRERLADPATQVIITTGGTGISARDGTFEAVDGAVREAARRLRRAVPHDQLQEIGSAAMMSRATAGTVGRKAIFVLPGSPAAVRLAMEKLIVPELGHVVQQLAK